MRAVQDSAAEDYRVRSFEIRRWKRRGLHEEFL